MYVIQKYFQDPRHSRPKETLLENQQMDYHDRINVGQQLLKII